MSRSSRPVRYRVAILTALLALVPRAAATTAPTYTITPISPTPGVSMPNVAPFSLNDTGTVSFWYFPDPGSGRSVAYLWHDGIAATPIPTSPGDALTFRLNNQDIAPGTLTDPVTDTSQAFLFDPSTNSVTYPALPTGQPLGALRTVNDFGLAGGYVNDPVTGRITAVLWDSAHDATLLPHLGQGSSIVESINNAGQAVGTSGNSGTTYFPMDRNSPFGQSHAALWQNGAVTDLTPGCQWSFAFDINDRGQVVGEYWPARYAQLPSGDTVPILEQLPYLHDPDRGFIPLSAPDHTHTGASALNDAGYIVGNAFYLPDQYSRPLLWTPDDSRFDLNSLLPSNSGWVLETVSDINSAGQIIGNGTYLGQQAAFLLTPTPEPILTFLVLPLLLRLTTRPPSRQL